MKYRRFLAISVVVPMLLVFAVPQAQAWMVLHGFTDPCHEMMALQSYDFVLKGMDIEGVYPPEDEVTRKVFKNFGKELEIDYIDDLHEFYIGSMILGVRQPDTDGHSMLDFNRARAMHMAEGTQSNHGLRNRFDDGEEGDKMAILATRRKIESMLQKALFYASGPLEERYIKVSHPIEYYGDVQLTVYAPMYYAGIAMHTFQDTFSHMIRSDDLREVHHVMNYIDAAVFGHEEKRDGLAHSLTMDDCFGDASEIAETAIVATSELMRAFIADFRVCEGEAVDQVLDDWLQLKPGCTMENDYCNSRWLPIARREQTEPILEEIFGCSTHGSPGNVSFSLLLLAILFLLRLKTWRMKRKYLRKHMISAAVVFGTWVGMIGPVSWLQAEEAVSPIADAEAFVESESGGEKTEKPNKTSTYEEMDDAQLSPLPWSLATFHSFTDSFYLCPEIHGSLFNDAKDDRTSIGDTFGYALKAGYRWELIGAFFQVEQNFWTSTELDRTINQGALNLGVGIELNYLHGYVRSSLAIGPSILLFDTMIDEAGETGVFLDFRPVALRWPMTEHVALVLDPLSFALVAPVIEGFPLVMMEYRTVFATEFNF